VLASDQDSLEPFKECLNRFGQEARALRQLAAHGAAGDGVVKVATFFQANGTAYTVMEFVDGLSLDQVITRQPDGLAPAMLDLLVPRLVHAIACVHAAGLLHRDIKPSNIILRPDGRPVLIDFGAARAATQGRTRTFTQIFSEGYAPIEQFSGTHQGPFSDIYALGSTFYRAIGGTTIDSFTRHQALLRGKPDPQPKAAKIGAGRYDPRLLAAIDAAIAVAPEDRPQTVAALLQLLEPDTADAPTVTAPKPKPAPPPNEATVLRPPPAAAPRPAAAPAKPNSPAATPGRREAVATGAAAIAACLLLAAYLIWRTARTVEWTAPPATAAATVPPAHAPDPAPTPAGTEAAPSADRQPQPPPPAQTTALAKATQAQPATPETGVQTQAEQARDKLNDLIFAATAQFEELGLPHAGFPATARQERDDAVNALNQQDWPKAEQRFTASYPIITAEIRAILGLAAAAAVQTCHQDLAGQHYDDAQTALDRAKHLKQALQRWPSPNQTQDPIAQLLAAQDRVYQRQSIAAKLLATLGFAPASATDTIDAANLSLAEADRALASSDITAAAAAFTRAADTIDSGTRDTLQTRKDTLAETARRDLDAGKLKKAQSGLDKAKSIQQALDQWTTRN
jgi:hypothetical protein